MKPACRIVLVCSVFAASLALGAQEWISLAKTEPSALYGEKCGMCHRDGGMGTGILARKFSGDLAVLENRHDLQPSLIETAVRNGIGIMFPISRAELSDAQLQVVVNYLVDVEEQVSGPPLDAPVSGDGPVPSGSETGPGADAREGE